MDNVKSNWFHAFAVTFAYYKVVLVKSIRFIMMGGQGGRLERSFMAY